NHQAPIVQGQARIHAQSVPLPWRLCRQRRPLSADDSLPNLPQNRLPQIRADELRELCEGAGIDTILRGHQNPKGAFESFDGDLVMTIFAATNYGEYSHGCVADIKQIGNVL
ncbi:hypothetical protein PMAYCL1PPCAC_26290, partial [Pristionchus mayeri]